MDLYTDKLIPAVVWGRRRRVVPFRNVDRTIELSAGLPAGMPGTVRVLAWLDDHFLSSVVGCRDHADGGGADFSATTSVGCAVQQELHSSQSSFCARPNVVNTGSLVR